MFIHLPNPMRRQRAAPEIRWLLSLVPCRVHFVMQPIPQIALQDVRYPVVKVNPALRHLDRSVADENMSELGMLAMLT